jgi:hypothetical protein
VLPVLGALRGGFGRRIDEPSDLLERQPVDRAQEESDPLLRLDLREACEHVREILARGALVFG